MSTKDLETRFGAEAARAVSEIIGSPSIGGPRPAPAARDRARGALIGAAIGETLGRPVEWLGREEIAARFGRITGHIGPAAMGEDSLLALITADSVLAGSVDHPARFARRLAGVHHRFASRATGAARRALREGTPWWSAAPGSAGTAAAVRCIAFGLRWTGDPRRAAYEAALSAVVTHRHPAAVSAAAAAAAGVALAAGGSGPLDSAWLEEAAEICSGFAQRAVRGVRVDARLKQLPGLLGPKAADSSAQRAEEGAGAERSARHRGRTRRFLVRGQRPLSRRRGAGCGQCGRRRRHHRRHGRGLSRRPVRGEGLARRVDPDRPPRRDDGTQPTGSAVRPPSPSRPPRPPGKRQRRKMHRCTFRS